MTARLVGLRAEQFKRLELVDLDLDGATGNFAVMGDNEAGKSSLLDALETVLAGRKATKFAQPIHNDGDEAKVIATFDDIVVTRTFKKGKPPTITIVSTDGRKFSNTEEIVKALYAHVALDPLAFSRLTDAEQVGTLLPLIGYDPAADDAERKKLFDTRTDVGRDRDALKARLAAIDSFPVAPKRIDRAQLTVRLNAAINLVGVRNEAEMRVELTTNAIDTAIKNIAQTEEQLEQMRVQKESLIAQLISLENMLEETERPDIEAITGELAVADLQNKQADLFDARLALETEYNTEVGKADTLTAQIKSVTDRKAAALAAAVMPVPELTIDPETNLLLLEGVPFSQASTGRKIRTGTAIAMALNPDLRLIVIRDASLLDSRNKAVIDTLAKDNGFLVLMEIADENQPVGVVIEEGNVKEVRSRK